MADSVASVGARFTMVSTTLLITAIAARIMTKEEFGLWAILTSSMYISLNFDFGFRFGLGNRLAAIVAIAGGKTDFGQRNLFLSTLFLQIGIGITGAIAGFFIVPSIQWTSLLKIHQLDLIANVNILILIVFVSLFLNLPSTLMGPGFFAYQEVRLACLLNAGQSLVQLIVFWLVSLMYSFKTVLICYFITCLMTGVICTVIFFKRRGWKLTWIPLNIQIEQIKSLACGSLDFFMLSLSAAVVYIISTFLAGNVAGLAAAGDFDLIKKIFGLLITAHLALLAPLAPAYTKEAQLGHWEWVREKLSFCTFKIWPVLFIGGGGIIYLLHPLVLRIWSGRTLADYTLAGLLVLSAALSGWTNTRLVLLNSLGLVRLQVAVAACMTPLYIFLPIYMGKQWGVNGIAAGILICMLPGAFLWPIYTTRAIRSELLKV